MAVIVLETCIYSNATALGIRLLGQDAEAGARGDAFVATADNPSAIYYNPAGITQLPGEQFRIGAAVTWWDRDQTSRFTGQKAEAGNTLQAVPQFFYSFSLGEQRPSIGLGFYSPFGFSADWPAFDSSLRMDGYLDYYVLNPVLAIPICPTLSIGGGVQLVYSDIKENTDLIDPVIGSQMNHAHGSGTGIGYNLGLLWQPQPQHSIGLSYHSTVAVDYDIHYFSRFESPGSPAFGGSFTGHKSFRFPMNVVAGYSYRPSEKWNLEFNLDWTDWDDARPANWQSSFIYKWGVTRTFTNGWQISAGYSFAENSVPESSFYRLIPDSNQHFFSVGAGRRFGNCDMALAYRLGYSEPRSISNLDINGHYLISGVNGAVVENSVWGRYEAISQTLMLSFGWHF